ncbi:hypothetical protein EAY55_14245, partial [Enterococcus faecalis]|nr:hypothetical protein [Enterococcus faecalis]
FLVLEKIYSFSSVFLLLRMLIFHCSILLFLYYFAFFE